MNEDVVVVVGPTPDTAVTVIEGGIEHIVTIEETGPTGPRGPRGVEGPVGPAGQGVLVLDMGDPIPEGTPDNTVIFRKEPG